jgi:hypothetical protein
MKFLLFLVVCCGLTAQTPNLSSVWKLNAEKSMFAGPSPCSYSMLVAQQESKLSVKAAIGGSHGVERSSYGFTWMAGRP